MKKTLFRLNLLGLISTSIFLIWMIIEMPNTVVIPRNWEIQSTISNSANLMELKEIANNIAVKAQFCASVSSGLNLSIVCVLLIIMVFIGVNIFLIRRLPDIK